MLPGPPEALVTQDLERGLPCGLWGMCVYVCALSAPPTGPLPAPLLVLCPSRAELDHWLYHLEKQTALLGGLQHCHSAPPQGSCGDELPWTLQRRLSRLRTASGHEPGGSAVCASRVKLQHLPAQEQWDRLLVLYPTSLAIFSEELDGLCFKVGPSPLWARPREAPVWGWKGAAVQEEPVFRGLLRQSARPAVLVSLVSP